MKSYEKILKIVESDAGERLDRYVYLYLKRALSSEISPLISRSLVTSNYQAIAKVRGKNKTKASYALREGDEIAINLKLVQKLLDEEADKRIAQDRIVAENGPLNIIEETDRYILLDKPSDLVMHPGTGNSSGTLANFIKGYLLEKGEFDKGLERVGIVHRLDKGVSGLVIVAKSRTYQLFLKKIFEQHKVTKIYVADIEKIRDTYFTKKLEEVLEEGNYIPNEVLDLITKSFPRNPKLPWLKVSGYIGRDPSNRYVNKFTIGKPLNRATRNAVSYFLLLSKDQIAIKIETGRMHQIRATLKRIGYQIIGDTLYGKPYKSSNKTEIHLRSRILAFIDKNGDIFRRLIK